MVKIELSRRAWSQSDHWDQGYLLSTNMPPKTNFCGRRSWSQYTSTWARFCQICWVTYVWHLISLKKPTQFNESSGDLACYCSFLAKGQKNYGIIKKIVLFMIFLCFWGDLAQVLFLCIFLIWGLVFCYRPLKF